MIPVTARYSVFTAPTGLSVIIEVEGDKHCIELKHSKSRTSGFKLSLTDFDQLIQEANRIKEFIHLFTAQFDTADVNYGRNSSTVDTIVNDSHSKDSPITYTHESYPADDHDCCFV